MCNTNSWKTLQDGIMFKQQNYYGSCFAAAYQNLAANIYLSRREMFVGNYYDIERQEYNYMLHRGCDIIENSPPTTNVQTFMTDDLNHRGFSRNLLFNAITVQDLIGFATNENRYNMGFTLWTGDNSNLHACALFIKNINGKDHYIYLDSNITYISADFKYYAQPCSNKLYALNELGLHDSLIQGGMTAYFY